MTSSAPTLAPGRVRSLTWGAVALSLLLAGCATAASPSASSVTPTASGSGSGASATATGSPATPSGSPVALTVGLGYIPNIQFAQFYLAQQAGYYRDAGLTVTFQNKIDPDLVPLVGQGNVDIGIADGTSVIPAVSQGIPVKYVATIYAQNPNVVIARDSSGIHTAADLKGKRIGIPGEYGSSWIMLQALLKSANLTPSDVQIVQYPDFGQAVALQQGAIDAATGFANNEPIQLEAAGLKLVILTLDKATPLPGPGLITGTATLQNKASALRAFVAATLKAMKVIEADPQQGLTASIAQVPELAQNPATQLAVLKATIAMWTSPYTQQHGDMTIDQAAWTQSIAFMTSIGLVPKPVTLDQLVSDQLLASP
ncbi:MAG TPA: ABC transporter substrate-binding protein [Candidatus Saccharimonadales bacterium]|nr:ABC transporter substrate-binding protein [Candidatus Saccharimonadales bacterium]